MLTAAGWGAAIQNLTPELAESFGFREPTGVLISDVVPDGPAEKAGIRGGDIVTDIDGKSLRDANHLRHVVAATQPEKTANVTIFREGRTRQIKVRIGLLPREPGSSVIGRSERAAPPEEDSVDDLGVSGQSLTPESAEAVGATTVMKKASLSPV